MSALPFAAARLFDTPLAIHPGKAAAILAGLGERVLGGSFHFDGPEVIDHIAFSVGRPSAGRLGDPLGRRIDAMNGTALDIMGSVAIIPVEGTLVHKGAWLGKNSGDTSYEGLQTKIRSARSNRAVKAVVFEIDSFGGEVAGAFDTAAMIRSLSAEKPTLAILTDHALSAGYLLASSARQIIVPESGRTGSIGVMMLHTDRSKMLEKNGIKVTILSAGKFKTEGNSFEPLSEGVADKIRASLEQGRQQFAAAVSAGRGKRMTLAQALATEADDFSGAEAVRLGLADAVGHSSEAFDDFLNQINRSSHSSSLSSKGSHMTTPALAAARAAADTNETFSAAQVEAARAEGLATGRAEAATAAKSEGVTAERARIQGIIGSEKAKGREAMANHLAFKTDMSVEAAEGLLDATPLAAAAATKSPLQSAMDGNADTNLGPAPQGYTAPAPRAIDLSGIYARRAAQSAAR